MQTRHFQHKIAHNFLSQSDLPSFELFILELQTPNQLMLKYQKEQHVFNVVYDSDWSEAAFQRQLKRGQKLQSPVILIAPYFNEKKIQTLQKNRINGIDLCGNGIIISRGLLLGFVGRPNQFLSKEKHINPYAGVTAQVLRVLLRSTTHKQLEHLHQEIQRRGGTITASGISRAMKALESDYIAGKKQSWRAVLWQPEAALEKLSQSWAKTSSRIIWRGRIQQPLNEFLPKIFQNAARENAPVVMTGIGSAPKYTNINLENTAYVYAESFEALLQDLPTEKTERFPNLEIRLSPDQNVFFDTYTDQQGIRWASILQSYLEMSRGDARLQDAAQPIKKRIIAEAQAQLSEVM